MSLANYQLNIWIYNVSDYLVVRIKAESGKMEHFPLYGYN